MDDLSKVAAALKTNLGVEGKDFGQAFDVLAAQGKTGAVELSEMARELAGLTPQFATFGKTGVEGLGELGAALQLTRSGFGTTAEAATGFRSIMTNIVQNAAKFRKAGIKIFEVGPDGKKHLRDIADIIFEIGDSKLGKDPTKLQQALGSSEAYRAILPLLKAGRGEFEKLAHINAKGTIDKDFGTFMDSSAGKIQSAGAAMKEAFNNSLKDNIAGIAKAMKGLAEAINWIGQHPYLAAAAFAGLRFGPQVVGALLSGGTAAAGAAGAGSAAAGAAGAGAGAGATGAGLGVAGSAGLVLAAAAAGAALGTLANKTWNLDERFSSLLRNGTFERRDDEMTDDEKVAMFADRDAKHAKAVDTAERQRIAAELQSYGYRGSISNESIDALRQGQGLTQIRQSAAAARALGATPEDIKRLGTDELMRQFPTALGMGMTTKSGPLGIQYPAADWRTELDTNAANAARRKAGDQALALPGTGKKIDVNVIVSVDPESGNILANVIENSKQERRR